MTALSRGQSELKSEKRSALSEARLLDISVGGEGVGYWVLALLAGW